MIEIKRILVATDFGKAAMNALAYARDLARHYGATLHVLFVEDAILLRYSIDDAPLFKANVQGDLEQAAQARLDALLTDDDRGRLDARASVTTSLAPALEIVEYATAHQIDLIVMGTHGGDPFAHMLVGSVAERVIRTAPCPVLTVRHPARECTRREAPVAAARA